VSTRRRRIRQSKQPAPLIGDAQTIAIRSPTCEELFEAHAGRLDRLCRLLLADRDESREVVQEVFLKVHQARRQPEPPSDWAAWLTRVTVNACRDRRRAGWWWRFRRQSDRVEDVALASPEPTPEEAAISNETWRRIWTAFRGLSDRQREVFVLRHLEGWSTDVVAATLRLTPGSVKRHLFRAIQHLRTAAVGDSA
jgi:RNA polymerase sigma-70 factor (ECF subfamily)